MPRSLSPAPRHSRLTWGMAQGLLIALALLLVLRPAVLGGVANSLEWDTLDWWFSLANAAFIALGCGFSR